MNYGAGITTNIPIRKRFSFNPGLVFSAYNMVLEDNQSLITQTEYANITTLGVNAIAKNNSTVIPSEVQLAALDIPINFQYQFLQRKKGNYFLELGFSSLLYLSENYSYSLTYIHHGGGVPGTVSASPRTVTEESSTPAF